MMNEYDYDGLIRRSDALVQSIERLETDYESGITRLTLIGADGREFEIWNIQDIEFHLQDGGRTLKIFYKTERK